MRIICVCIHLHAGVNMYLNICENVPEYRLECYLGGFA